MFLVRVDQAQTYPEKAMNFIKRSFAYCYSSFNVWKRDVVHVSASLNEIHDSSDARTKPYHPLITYGVGVDGTVRVTSTFVDPIMNLSASADCIIERFQNKLVQALVQKNSFKADLLLFGCSLSFVQVCWSSMMQRHLAILACSLSLLYGKTCVVVLGYSIY